MATTFMPAAKGSTALRSDQKYKASQQEGTILQFKFFDISPVIFQNVYFFEIIMINEMTNLCI